MSWLFSRALVAEYLADICSDGEPSAPSSGNPIQQAYLSHGKTTDFSRISRFGMTFKPLTDAHGEALLTSYLAASLARTSVQPVLAWVLRGVEVDSGAKWPASSAKFDLASSSWKTAHCLWEEDLPLSSVILPRWGMTRSGFVFQHPTSERPISETASGLWPTPTVPNGGRSMTPEMVMNGGYTPSGQKRQIGLENAVRYWPTPKANDAEKRGNFDVTNPRNGLPAADKRWPTPTKSDHKGSGPTMIRSDGKLRGDRLDYATERAPDGTSTGGQLNPTWVEWLMGWPLGWTDLKPLGMDKFREWQLQHSPCFLEGREAA